MKRYNFHRITVIFTVEKTRNINSEHFYSNYVIEATRYEIFSFKVCLKVRNQFMKSRDMHISSPSRTAFS